MSELHIIYKQIFGQLQKGCSDLSQEQLLALLPKLQQCMEMVSSEALFSRNEDMDDIPTESIKVVCNCIVHIDQSSLMIQLISISTFVCLE